MHDAAADATGTRARSSATMLSRMPNFRVPRRHEALLRGRRRRAYGRAAARVRRGLRTSIGSGLASSAAPSGSWLSRRSRSISAATGCRRSLTSPGATATTRWSSDAKAFIDHLEIERCACVGYSMGATQHAAPRSRPGSRVSRSLCSAASGMPPRPRQMGGDVIADAMQTDDKSTITHPIAKSFRDFADLTRPTAKRSPRCSAAGASRVR